MASIVYGFKNLLDIPDKRAATVDPRQLMSAIAYSQAQHDAELRYILNLFCEPTTAIQLKFKSGAVAAIENQPLDEYGRSRKINVTKADYTTGFPIYSSGQALGTTFLARAKMTIQQFNDELDAIYRGDFQWVRNRVLATIFTNTARTVDDPESVDGAVTVNPMANNDAVVYRRVGSDSLSADNHYLAFADPIDDTHNPIPTIRDELIEHEDNTGEVVVFISSSLKLPTPTTGVEALTEFVEWGGFSQANDPALRYIPAPPLVEIIRPLNMTLPPGARYLGRVNQVHVVEWPTLPSGYGFAMTIGGPRPLKVREDAEAELRGFKPVASRDDFPYIEQQWMRRMGFGGWNRVAIVVFRIGNAGYAVPTIYQNIRWS